MRILITNDDGVDAPGIAVMREIAAEIPFAAYETYLPRRTSYQTAQLNGWKSIPFAHRADLIKLAMEVARSILAEASDGRIVGQ